MVGELDPLYLNATPRDIGSRAHRQPRSKSTCAATRAVAIGHGTRRRTSRSATSRPGRRVAVGIRSDWCRGSPERITPPATLLAVALVWFAVLLVRAIVRGDLLALAEGPGWV